MTRIVPALVIAATLCVLGTRTASAQKKVGELELTFLVDGGAVPFVWLALGVGVTLDNFASPRRTPLWFDEDEGGLPSRKADELPGWAASAGSTSLGIVIALDDSPGRWFHVKGFMESVTMTSLVTRLFKLGFGRHRPDYDPATATDEERRSFVSGHASRSAAALTYLGLYLHGHVLDGAAWNLAVYACLAAVEVGISSERVYHHRHHVTDVIAGSLLGMTSSVVFFLWQERRYRRALARQAPLPPPADAPPLPAIDGPSVAWAWSF